MIILTLKPGAADWVIDGAFSDYADSMRKQGYQVKELEGESNISDQSLHQAHVLVIPEANNPFKENEQKAIINFVKMVVASFSSQTTIMPIVI